MAKITRLEVTIKTGDLEGAGTDGDVYLAIAGREFNLDNEKDNFERFHVDEFLLGDDYTSDDEDSVRRRKTFLPVFNRDENDPNHPPLDLNDIDNFPVWIRLSPTGEFPSWLLESVRVDITVDKEPTTLKSLEYGAFFDEGLWLGRAYGLFCFLKKREPS